MVEEIIMSHSFSCRGVDKNRAPHTEAINSVTAPVPAIINVWRSSAMTVHCPTYNKSTEKCVRLSEEQNQGKCPYSRLLRE